MKNKRLSFKFLPYALSFLTLLNGNLSTPVSAGNVQSCYKIQPSLLTLWEGARVSNEAETYLRELLAPCINDQGVRNEIVENILDSNIYNMFDELLDAFERVEYSDRDISSVFWSILVFLTNNNLLTVDDDHIENLNKLKENMNIMLSENDVNKFIQNSGFMFIIPDLKERNIIAQKLIGGVKKSDVLIKLLDSEKIDVQGAWDLQMIIFDVMTNSNLSEISSHETGTPPLLEISTSVNNSEISSSQQLQNSITSHPSTRPSSNISFDELPTLNNGTRQDLSDRILINGQNNHLYETNRAFRAWVYLAAFYVLNPLLYESPVGTLQDYSNLSYLGSLLNAFIRNHPEILQICHNKNGTPIDAQKLKSLMGQIILENNNAGSSLRKNVSAVVLQSVFPTANHLQILEYLPQYQDLSLFGDTLCDYLQYCIRGLSNSTAHHFLLVSDKYKKI